MFGHGIRATVFQFVILLLFLSGTNSYAQNFEGVQIKSAEVTKGVHMLVGMGGNIAVSVGEDSVFMIDDQYAPLTGRIRAAIASISGKPIQFVINTHWHRDHTGGNENLGETGAVIVAHENVRKRLSTEQLMGFFKRTVPASPESALPVMTFTRDVTFHLNGDEMHIFHVAHAHTDGDVIIQFRKSNVIHMGDVYFEGAYPFIDLTAGGSIDGTIAAVEQVLPIIDENTKVIPGHGPLSDEAGLKAYHKMLTAVRDRISHQIKLGKTLEEIMASGTTQEFDPVWGGGFLKPEQFVEIVYKSLKYGR